MNTEQSTKQSVNFERLGECLYRKGSTIYARVRLNKKLTWRSTGTDIPSEARKWLAKWHGAERSFAASRGVTVGELIDSYVEAGMPTRKMRPKRPATITNEKACLKPLAIDHVTPHGLRSHFVTQARQSGLSDAEIAMLIGAKSGPAIIALTYGDVRPDHLLKQAQRIRLTVQASSNKSSIASPDVSGSSAGVPEDADNDQTPVCQGF